MAKFTIEIKASKEVIKDQSYSYSQKETVNIKEVDIFEALRDWCDANAYSVSQISVTNEEK